MTKQQENKLNKIMWNWWHGNLADARQGLRRLHKKDLAQLLVNQQQLEHGAWSREYQIKLEDWIIGTLETSE